MSINWWDGGRFIRTLAYFGKLPVWADLDWLRQWLSIPGGAGGLMPKRGGILVVGADTDLGQQVVKKLADHPLRALVRDRDQAVEGVEAVVADLQCPETLDAGLFAGIEAVVYCFAESGVALGLHNLIQATARHFAASPPRGTEATLFDVHHLDLQETWGAVDDVVMGGVSESKLLVVEGGALFTGRVSTANSGGFASVRTRDFNPRLDLSRFSGIALRVKGDGQRYKFLLRTDERWDSVAYSASFDTVPKTWISVQIPFTRLIPVFRAKTLPDAPPVDTAHISALQLMLSKFEYDGALNPSFRPGPFHLEVASITAYGANPLPRLILVQAEGRDIPDLACGDLPYTVLHSSQEIETRR
ncbi:CIA30 family protein [Anthocerotibacter panamensis]|uniref:CIA30 family protein n=1 Tax=Anthocerotibacter panamensis TaxID=2857077 RepID=UPI001C404797|nr:CIA30 family protein [Anthocerotibacter panamensis]